jgi:hypothetical protein
MVGLRGGEGGDGGVQRDLGRRWGFHLGEGGGVRGWAGVWALLFYSNEHEPIHVHGKYQGRESRAELVIREGLVVEIIYSPVGGRRPLEGAQLKDFQTLVGHYADDIVRKWIDYFVLHRRVEAEVITRKIK